MSENFLISDSLLNQLMAAGQADLVLGMITCNDESTVGPVVKTVLQAFSNQLLRQRTVLIALDIGSKDQTLSVIAAACAENLVNHPLRTVHRIVESYPELPNQATAGHILMLAADLLQAKCLIIVDAHDLALSGDELKRLASGVWHDRLDLIRPVLPRLPTEGLLLSQIIRPLVASIFSAYFREPLALPVAISHSFLSTLLQELPWPLMHSGLAVGLSVTIKASLNRFRLGELPLARRDPALARPMPLKDVFHELLTTLFDWIGELPKGFAHTGMLNIQTVDGSVAPVAMQAQMVEYSQDWDEFAKTRSTLQSIWEQILRPETMAHLSRVDDPRRGIDDELWVAIISDFIQAKRRSVMPSRQLAQSLLPIYHARTASVEVKTDSQGYFLPEAGTDPLLKLLQEKNPLIEAGVE